VVSVTPRPRFSPGERSPGTHCTGGWASSRSVLDTEVRVKIILHLLVVEPRSPGRPLCIQALYRLSYPGSQISVDTEYNSLRCQQTASSLSSQDAFQFIVCVILSTINFYFPNVIDPCCSQHVPQSPRQQRGALRLNSKHCRSVFMT
jgi:hypothetical protein